MLGCRWISLDDVPHALLAYSFAVADRSHFEISSESASRESGPASPTPGADPKSQPAPVELSGPCLLGMAFPLLERMEDSDPVRAARYRHPLASGGFSPFLEMEEAPYKSWPRDIAPDTISLIRDMSRANPLWGAPRIHSELLKLDLPVARRTVAKYMARRPPRSLTQNWKTFLHNHLGQMVSVDFLTVPTLNFQLLYVFLVLSHRRRNMLHLNVVEAPSARWAAQQLREAFPFTSPPKYLLRDRDGIYGSEFQLCAAAIGLEQLRIAPSRPWQSPYVERLIGSIGRECLDHVLVLNRAHLHRVLEIGRA